MPFFHFSQNNSGGFFIENDRVQSHVIVEAANADEANARAKEVGIYFNGCYIAEDCDCCGDRWYSVCSTEAEAVPSIYGTPVEEFEYRGYNRGAWVYYSDGRKVGYGAALDAHDPNDLDDDADLRREIARGPDGRASINSYSDWLRY